MFRFFSSANLTMSAARSRWATSRSQAAAGIGIGLTDWEGDVQPSTTIVSKTKFRTERINRTVNLHRMTSRQSRPRQAVTALLFVVPIEVGVGVDATECGLGSTAKT